MNEGERSPNGLLLELQEEGPHEKGMKYSQEEQCPRCISKHLSSRVI